MAKAYLVTATVPAPKDAEDQTGKSLKAYAGSQSEAADHKRNWLDSHETLKRSAVRIDPIDVPTNKADLIVWLNQNAV